jgi:hypothetical protein
LGGWLRPAELARAADVIGVSLRDVDAHPSRLRTGAGRRRWLRCASDEECKAWLKPAGRMSITSLWRRGGELV